MIHQWPRQSRLCFRARPLISSVNGTCSRTLRSTSSFFPSEEVWLRNSSTIIYVKLSTMNHQRSLLNFRMLSSIQTYWINRNWLIFEEWWWSKRNGRQHTSQLSSTQVCIHPREQKRWMPLSRKPWSEGTLLSTSSKKYLRLNNALLSHQERFCFHHRWFKWLITLSWMRLEIDSLNGPSRRCFTSICYHTSSMHSWLTTLFQQKYLNLQLFDRYLEWKT